MPELPEVETIKNELLALVAGRRITGIDLPWKGIIQTPSPKDFCFQVVGQKITDITRHGKYLIFHLGEGRLLIMHLRMTGSLLLRPAGMTEGRFARAAIHLDDGHSIVFRDPRKFGRMWLAADTSTISAKLGPEPLLPVFTPELLARRLAHRSAPIKALLLDQAFIAGIGNMYADEALFGSGLHPLRPGKDLSPEEIERLTAAIREVLQAAIDNQGASVENYFRPDGTPGTAHLHFKVAHRGGQPCPICGTPLQRTVVRNRGTCFCPCCQA